MTLPNVIEILVKDIEVEFSNQYTVEEPTEVYLTSLLMAILEDLSRSSSGTRNTVQKARNLDTIADAKSALESSELPKTFLKRVEKERKIQGRRGYKLRRRA